METITDTNKRKCLIRKYLSKYLLRVNIFGKEKVLNNVIIKKIEEK